MKRHIETAKQHKFKIIGLGLILVIGGLFISRDKTVAEEPQQTLKKVETVQISELVSSGGEISTVGTLKANQQLDLRTQMAGQISAIRVSVGQEVRAGQALVEVSHRDLDASVAQAQASLTSAIAQYEKLKNGARAEDLAILQQQLLAAQTKLEDQKNGARNEDLMSAQIAVEQAENALNDALRNLDRTQEGNEIAILDMQQDAVQAIASAQISADKIINEDLDDLFDIQDGYKILPEILDIDLENEANRLRPITENNVNAWMAASSSLDSNNQAAVLTALNRAEAEVRGVLNFLSVTSNALTEAHGLPDYTTSQIATQKTLVNAGRATVQAHLDSVLNYQKSIPQQEIRNAQALDAASTQINNARSNLETAEERAQIALVGDTNEQLAIQETQVAQIEQQIAIAKNGARPEDLRLQEASIASARASLALAAANRDKAIVIAPISGKVTYLDKNVGDFLTSSDIAISLANEEGLEVEGFVTENERKLIEVGNVVMINDDLEGVVREIAPALDPVTRKIKVLVTVVTEEVALTLGETVRIKITKNLSKDIETQLPLSSVKLRASGASILVVNQDNIIEEINVETGRVIGDSIAVKTEISPDWIIVQDARGLKSGTEVEIK